MSFLQMLLEALSKPDVIVLDAFASTGLYFLLLHHIVVSFYLLMSFSAAGNLIRACRNSGRHIVALESHPDIFNAILKPLAIPAPDPAPDPKPKAVVVLDDDVQVRKIVKRSRLVSKFACRRISMNFSLTLVSSYIYALTLSHPLEFNCRC